MDTAEVAMAIGEAGTLLVASRVDAASAVVTAEADGAESVLRDES
jgi:hypothetical protein